MLRRGGDNAVEIVSGTATQASTSLCWALCAPICLVTFGLLIYVASESYFVQGA
jgi:hypothetical protein